MARLFAFIANRPDLGARVMAAESTLLEERASDSPLGWGVGFYQGGEVLLRRRPIDERPVLPLGDAVHDIRSDVLIGQVRQATVGTMRTENTHPFRHRQWLFAHTGTVAGFPGLRDRLAESIPQFLRRNVRGDTDSELLFHLFLSFLHDSGKLDHPSVDPADVRVALRSCLSLVDRLSAEEGAEATGCNVLVTDGENVIALHGKGNMAYRLLQGRHDLEELLGDDGLRRTRVPDVASSRLVMLIADYEGDATRFTPVENRAILTLTRAADPLVETL
jgi:predicted glutamine amidotransferase